MALNVMCMNSDCVYYYEDNCIRDINDERVEISKEGKCLSFKEGISSLYKGTRTMRMGTSKPNNE